MLMTSCEPPILAPLAAPWTTWGALWWALVLVCVRLVSRALWWQDVSRLRRPVPVDPKGLTEYIVQTERKSDAEGPVKAGAEKHIWWARGDGKRTKHAIVYLHGFSACRQDACPIIDQLAKATGMNCFQTRLTGHGGKEPLKKFTGLSSRDLFQDLREAMSIGEALCTDGIIIIGYSTGGALACYILDTELGRRLVRKAMLISPAFGLQGASRVFCKPFLIGDYWFRAQILRLLFGSRYHWSAQNEEQTKWWSMEYPPEAIAAVLDAVGVASSCNFEKIEQPVLIIGSEKDVTVDFAVTMDAARRLPKAEVFTPPKFNCAHAHVIAGNIVSPSSTQDILAKMIDFVGDLQNSST